jgi:hypothetical protein
MIRKERNDKRVDKEDAARNRQTFHEWFGPHQPGNSFFVGAFKNISQSNFRTNRDAKVGSRISQRKVRPRTPAQLGPKSVPGSVRSRGKDATLVTINAKTRKGRKAGDEMKGRGDSRDAVGGNSQVISEGKARNVRELGERKKQGVIRNDENKGREGTPLFNPSANVDPVDEFLPKTRGDSDIV